MKQQQILSAQIGEQLFGLPIKNVEDVFVPKKITRIPLAVPEIFGVLNLRGRIITVIDMCYLMQINNNNQEPQKIAINAVYKNDFYGLLIDAIHEVIDVSDDDVTALPDTIDKKWRGISKGVVQLSKQLLVILDAKKIFELIIQRSIKQKDGVNNEKMSYSG